MRNLVLFFTLILIFSIDLHGQVKSDYGKSTDTTIYNTTELDSTPIFYYPKGELQNDKIMNYIKDHQLWPNQDDGVFIVYVKFIIEKDGSISKVAIVKGIHPDYDKEAIRLIKAMPIWKSGIKNNQFVRTEMVLPIKWTIFINK